MPQKECAENPPVCMPEEQGSWGIYLPAPVPHHLRGFLGVIALQQAYLAPQAREWPYYAERHGTQLVYRNCLQVTSRVDQWDMAGKPIASTTAPSSTRPPKAAWSSFSSSSSKPDQSQVQGIRRLLPRKGAVSSVRIENVPLVLSSTLFST